MTRFPMCVRVRVCAFYAIRSMYTYIFFLSLTSRIRVLLFCLENVRLFYTGKETTSTNRSSKV